MACATSVDTENVPFFIKCVMPSARAALIHLKSFWPKLYTFISLSSPHLGYMYSSNRWVEAGTSGCICAFHFIHKRPCHFRHMGFEEMEEKSFTATIDTQVTRARKKKYFLYFFGCLL